MQMEWQESQGSNTCIKQNRLKKKKKRQSQALHKDKGKNTKEDITLINKYAPNSGALSI